MVRPSAHSQHLGIRQHTRFLITRTPVSSASTEVDRKVSMTHRVGRPTWAMRPGRIAGKTGTHCFVGELARPQVRCAYADSSIRDDAQAMRKARLAELLVGRSPALCGT